MKLSIQTLAIALIAMISSFACSPDQDAPTADRGDMQSISQAEISRMQATVNEIGIGPISGSNHCGVLVTNDQGQFERILDMEPYEMQTGAEMYPVVTFEINSNGTNTESGVLAIVDGSEKLIMHKDGKTGETQLTINDLANVILEECGAFPDAPVNNSQQQTTAQASNQEPSVMASLFRKINGSYSAATNGGLAYLKMKLNNINVISGHEVIFVRGISTPLMMRQIKIFQRGNDIVMQTQDYNSGALIELIAEEPSAESMWFIANGNQDVFPSQISMNLAKDGRLISTVSGKGHDGKMNKFEFEYRK